jgi:hypothetical protein
MILHNSSAIYARNPREKNCWDNPLLIRLTMVLFKHLIVSTSRNQFLKVFSSTTSVVHSVQQKSSGRNIVSPNAEWRRRTVGDLIRVVRNSLVFVHIWLFSKFHCARCMLRKDTNISATLEKTSININDCSESTAHVFDRRTKVKPILPDISHIR